MGINKVWMFLPCATCKQEIGKELQECEVTPMDFVIDIPTPYVRVWVMCLNCMGSWTAQIAEDTKPIGQG